MSWATIVERGCGERKSGGIYAECGLGPGGLPLDRFLVDPPAPIPAGLDIINKAQVWEHKDSGVFHLVIWVGAEHYSYVADIIEEIRLYGASRRIGSMVDLSKLTPGQSRMILAHPKCRLAGWESYRKPLLCRKHIDGHDCRQEHEESLENWIARAQRPARSLQAALPDPMVVEGSLVGAGTGPGPHMPERSALALADDVQPGPCLYKAYELIPADAGTPDPRGRTRADLPAHVRQFASTTYTYYPTDEKLDGDSLFQSYPGKLEPGIFAVLPLHGFAIVKDQDGSTDQKKRAKMDASGMPYYEADK